MAHNYAGNFVSDIDDSFESGEFIWTAGLVAEDQIIGSWVITLGDYSDLQVSTDHTSCISAVEP